MSQQLLPFSTVPLRNAIRMPVGRNRLLNLFELWIDPLVASVSLIFVTLWFHDSIGSRYATLSLIVFALTFPGSAYLRQSLLSMIWHVSVGWVTICGLLLLFVYASGYLSYFDSGILVTWLWIGPVMQVASHSTLRFAAPAIQGLQGRHLRAIVVGANTQGLELASRLGEDPYSSVLVDGFFDDRTDDRTTLVSEHAILGKIAELPQYVKGNQIDYIYIALPMASQPRILLLLDELRDTTASIYFVPDVFVTDVIQGRIDSVSGLPVVAVCETPFTGFNGVLKRSSDIVLSLLILALISLPMLLIAAAVKLTSPGPAIFRQRRYGLAGDGIIVCKFRTMTVAEDGDVIQQAQKGDARLTSIGGFLRRTSLDELPQFFNVLQGRMSIVGPRPHAIAHNEMYRKLIKGYMQRHKVKPGITGWAQVNGYRGETRTTSEMKARIDFDLAYLRNWSLRLDLYIIAKTIRVVLLGDKSAY